MAERAGELRLFDLDDSSGDGVRSDQPVHIGDATVTRSIAAAARQLRLAQSRFGAAIDAGRRAGLSWRQIGAAAGVPFQTLHRRAGGSSLAFSRVGGSGPGGRARRRRSR